MILIGDIHGKLRKYQDITLKYEKTIALGDMGFAWEYNWIHQHIDPVNHKILQGNHDDYTSSIPHILGDFGIYNDLFFVRGAYSIDKHHRLEGRDWFREEELSYSQGTQCIELYESIKPSIVISHDCPQVIRENLFQIWDKSITSNILQEMLDIHKPDLWIFGHHHTSIEYKLDKTLFKCLKELETFKID